ncbi:MAG: exodeoxyribonuclease III [Oscillospiraceae bacterium]|jgi:exodeoxyribonuclease-3|nr:exodeoxyribonuclease III [Oscillospiraceae bacterium]
MRFVSWNVNGIRAILGKDFAAVFAAFNADVFCLQETKATREQARFEPDGYYAYWNSAEKKGYSGTAVFTKREPLAAICGIGWIGLSPLSAVPMGACCIPVLDCLPDCEHDKEGRVITLEYPEYFVVNVYTPNAQDGLRRLGYRELWEDAFRDYLCELDRIKPVLVCGDMNVAHQEIDLAHPAANIGNPGYTPEERAKFTALLESGFTDTFRMLHPNEPDRYSWWSYRSGARERNVGWRIDYWLCSDRLANKILAADIHAEVTGSDHCPVRLEIML